MTIEEIAADIGCSVKAAEHMVKAMLAMHDHIDKCAKQAVAEALNNAANSIEGTKRGQ